MEFLLRGIYKHPPDIKPHKSSSVASNIRRDTRYRPVLQDIAWIHSLISSQRQSLGANEVSAASRATRGMSTTFFNFPSELRNRVYELCLLPHESINPWISHTEKPTTGLLRVNKAVHREASSLFYAESRFDFITANSEDIDSFLQTIGRSNAGNIRHVYVSFPKLLLPQVDDVTLEESSNAIFVNIQSGCPNLRTLTTCLNSTNAMEQRLDALDNPKTASDALTLVDTCFRAILSLQEIFVEVYEKDDANDHIRRE